jgi:hypothetical protein
MSGKFYLAARFHFRDPFPARTRHLWRRSNCTRSQFRIILDLIPPTEGGFSSENHYLLTAARTPVRQRIL